MRKATKRYVSKQYDEFFKNQVLAKFEKKIGMDVSKYIFSFIDIPKHTKCRICEDKIGQNFCCCMRKNCDNKICRKCFKITSKYNKYVPYCDKHFNNYHYKKQVNKYFKKQLIKKMKRKIKRYSDVDMIQYIYKNRYTDKIINQFFCYNKYNHYFHTPRRTFIRCNHHLEVRKNILVVIFVDNIFDTFYYNLY